jgi:hypothetical protein
MAPPSYITLNCPLVWYTCRVPNYKYIIVDPPYPICIEEANALQQEIRKIHVYFLLFRRNKGIHKEWLDPKIV